MMHFVLPFPPSINSYYRVFNNRILLSAEGRKYKKAVREYVMLLGLKPNYLASSMAGMVMLGNVLLVNPKELAEEDRP